MKRPQRGKRVDDGRQLSFFDPGGDLPGLHAEAERLSHAAGLEDGHKRTQAAIAALEAERVGVLRDRSGADGIIDRFQMSIDTREGTVVHEDRGAAGEALKALLLAAEPGDLSLGRFAELAMGATLTNEGDGRFWAPYLQGGRRWIRGEDWRGQLSPQTSGRQIVAQFERVLANIGREMAAIERSLTRQRTEAANFAAQLADTTPVDRNRLEEVAGAIHKIVASDGLFGRQAEEEHRDRTEHGTHSEPIRVGAPEVVDTQEAIGIRPDEEGRRTGRTREPDRPRRGGLLRDGAEADAGKSGGKGRDERGILLKRGVGDGHGDRQLLAEQTAQRRERASRNYQITDADEIGAGTAKAKVAANIAAIRILKQLQDAQRDPTDAERQSLVKYVGWGAFAQAIFDTNRYARNAEVWRNERQALTDLITADEWEAARASTLNAHYTSVPVIRGMWRALDHLGFTGGRVLEPASGIGHFLGLTPEHLRDEISWTAAELDPLTGGIAKALYPGADIRVQGFETLNWPDGFFDLAISNVPFGDFAPRDPRYRRPLSIHDYFFVRSLDKVRPGGVVAFITSRYSLDKENDQARQEIAKRGHFLGAIRLPGGKDGAFAANAGTEVTTDIIFLKRRAEGDAASDDRWLGLTEIETPDGPTRINRYFADHPEMMLGELRLQGTMHAKAEPVLIGSVDNLDERIASAARHMPGNAFTPRGAARSEAVLPAVDTATDGIREGAFYVRENQIFRKVAGVGEPQSLSRTEAEKLRALIGIRDLVVELLRSQAAGDDQDRGELRDQLNTHYDAFYRRWGAINKCVSKVTERLRADGTAVVLRRFPNFAVFRDDPDAFKVAAIETYDEQKDEAVKAAIFSHDIVQPLVEPTILTPADALAVSLDKTGGVDIDLIAANLERMPAEAIAALGGRIDAIEALGDRIWLDPAGDVWRTAEEYLSGDVVGKLADARAAAEIDLRYERNVAALQTVQPTPLTRVDIKVLFGAPWVPVENYYAFFAEVLNAPLDEGSLTLNAITKKWLITKQGVPESVQAQHGTDRCTAMEVFAAAINNTEIRVMDPGPDNTVIYNPKASEEANAKVAAVRNLFTGAEDMGVDAWVWQDDRRAEQLETLYNVRFNRLVPTKFDGEHLSLPGVARYLSSGNGHIEPFNLRSHQTNAIWRGVSRGNMLIDHCVGAGKTFTMIAAGMEQRRLGLIQRPMYVVPNHMLEQFSREFLQLYPNAKILVADKDSMSRDKRKAFAARITAERWDGIIITHDAFGRIPMSDEAVQRFIRQEMDELDSFKRRAAAEEGKSSPTVKELEKARKRLEARLDKVIAKERKDDGVTFEELAVDFLFVDEAHAFKNLGFRTRHTRVKGLAATESQRATDMFLKIQYLEGKRPGRSVVFATGTPISNTIAEMYTMQRYLQLPLLREYGLDEFDAWAATYGEIVSQVELAPSGQGFRTTRSFTRFVNLPELVTLYSAVSDTQTADMLNLPRPQLRGGGIQIVECEMSPFEAAIMEQIVARAEAIKGKRVQKGSDNMLKIMGDGLKLATDVRLLDPTAPANDNGKIAKAVENIVRIYREGTPDGDDKLQMVFLDMGVPKGRARSASVVPALDLEDGEEDFENTPLASKFNLYEEMRTMLVAAGIPASEIAFIHDANNDVQKGRLFHECRDGPVRVLFGSTGKMGVGTNVQKRLVAMHHIDAPWRPADVEQRDGRILRQGNLNPEIQIYRYVTVGSLDAYRWQTLCTKAAFIAQIRAGASGKRVAEDIDSPLPEAAMIKAAATGDARIIEHAELSTELRTLETGRRSHERSIAAARNSKRHLLADIEKLEARIERARSDVGRIVDISGNRFTVTLNLGGRETVLDERHAAGEAMRARLIRVGAGLWSPDTVTHETLGQLGGFTMQAWLRRRFGELEVAAVIQGARRYSRDQYFKLSEDSDAIGLVRRYEGLLGTVPKVLEENEKALAAKQADLPRLDRQIAAGPYAKQVRLDEVKARVAELEDQLKLKEETMQATRHEDEWDRLEPQTQSALEELIEEAERSGQFTSKTIEDGEAHAYVVQGGIGWDVQRASGDKISGVRPRGQAAKHEREDEARGVDLSNADKEVAVAIAATSAVQNHITRLHGAGHDEEAFDNAFRALTADTSLDLKAITAIAGAYVSAPEDWATREAALGAIEQHFYAQIEAKRTVSRSSDSNSGRAA